jgi:hypothetical protein
MVCIQLYKIDIQLYKNAHTIYEYGTFIQLTYSKLTILNMVKLVNIVGTSIDH